MCKKRCRIIVSSLATAVLFAASLPSAWAITAGSAGPDWPVSVRVGDTGVPVGLEIVNTSSTGDVAGDTGQAKITSIKLVASCGTSTFPCTSAEPGVFQVNGPGIGSDGCAGITFLISAPDANNEITLTPDADVILDRFETCRIDFTADVLAPPATDADPIADGVQTFQKGFMTMEKTISAALTGTGTGTDITTVRFCGDGVVNDDEQCDDGNSVPYDGCGTPEDDCAICPDSTACGEDADPTDCTTPGCEAGFCVQGHNDVADSTACSSTADIPGDCGTPGCEAGVCVAAHNDVADSTACTSVTDIPGDCGTPGCEAGVCVATHNDVADSTPCTSTADIPGDCGTPGCEAGVCVATHNDEADSTPCTSTADIPGDCGTPGCEAGVCVATHNDEADSTPCTSTADIEGDCGTPGCEAGVCVATHNDVADSTACTTTADIPGDCGTPGCEAGVCVATHNDEADSTACTDTDGVDCTTAGCEAGVCVQTHIEDCAQQGCTPGFWKANIDNKGGNAWPASAKPPTTVEDVFDIPACVSSSFKNLTLRQALSLKGGSGLNGAAEILLRIGTGAYLNALSDCVEYPQTAAEVVADVNEALASCDREDILDLAATLDAQNNAGCPINQQGQCSNSAN
jgi:hypothetical protein